MDDQVTAENLGFGLISPLDRSISSLTSIRSARSDCKTEISQEIYQSPKRISKSKLYANGVQKRQKFRSEISDN